MAIRPILVAPNPILRKKSEPINAVDNSILRLINDMIDTLEDAGGVGLAAPQVGVNKRLIVVWVDDEAPYVLINPKITHHVGEKLCDEGCLSIPGMQGKVKRYREVTVKAIDPNGKPVKIEATGLKAQAFQHEIDHLDGILYTDKIEPGTLGKANRQDSLEDIVDDVYRNAQK